MEEEEVSRRGGGRAADGRVVRAKGKIDKSCCVLATATAIKVNTGHYCPRRQATLSPCTVCRPLTLLRLLEVAVS